MFEEQERIKNGKIVSSSSNTSLYFTLKNSLNSFTKEKYNRAISTVYFEDIRETFYKNYSIFLQKRGIANGNKRRNCKQVKVPQGSFKPCTLFP